MNWSKFSRELRAKWTLEVGKLNYSHPRIAPTDALRATDQSTVPPLARAVAEFISSKKVPIDLVVPMAPSKQRGVQPVRSIAASVAKRLDIAYDSRALRKVRGSPELKSMTELKDRRAALASAFIASAEALKGKSVLLLDDLYRSGASMEEAARAIRESGAKAVYALALTRTRTNR